jgi:tRNA dimethylallyltransferase
VEVLAIFGPTGVGKTGVAIALAEILRERGEDPVAISCDALQVYQGLEVLTGAASDEQRGRLEHRLLGFVPVTEPFSVGDYMRLAHAEVDDALERGRRPIVVGGTGLYLRAAIAELSLVRVPAEAEDSELWSAETRHPRSSVSTWSGGRSTSGSMPAPRRSSPAAPSRRS